MADYLRCGYYPFFSELRLDQEKFQAIENSTQKVIYEDIATLYSLGLFYSENGDFRVDDFVIEVGGKSKSKAQLKGNSKGYVLADDIISGYKNKIPLYLLGFLY